MTHEKLVSILETVKLEHQRRLCAAGLAIIAEERGLEADRREGRCRAGSEVPLTPGEAVGVRRAWFALRFDLICKSGLSYWEAEREMRECFPDLCGLYERAVVSMETGS